MQGFIQDFVLGEVRGTCVGGGSGDGHSRVVVRMVDRRAWKKFPIYLSNKQAY